MNTSLLVSRRMIDNFPWVRLVSSGGGVFTLFQNKLTKDHLNVKYEMFNIKQKSYKLMTGGHNT